MKTIAAIEKYVSLGYSQSASNCKVLLQEIHRLRAELKKVKNGNVEETNI